MIEIKIKRICDGILPILMTASVSTRGMKGACFSDEERSGMYAVALRCYVSMSCGVGLVFVDNSGWDLSTFRTGLIKEFGSEIVEKNVEFVALEPELFDISKGKGYNELLLINHAIERSTFIKKVGAFLKVTGRSPTFNILRFHQDAKKKLEKGDRFYYDIKSHNLYRRLGLKWSSHSFEARLWASKVDFYKENIKDLYIDCYDYDGRFVESVLFDKLSQITGGFKRCRSEGISVRFAREPRFGGVEGSNMVAKSFSKNQQSFKSKVKVLIGNFFRIFMPWFKF